MKTMPVNKGDHMKLKLQFHPSIRNQAFASIQYVETADKQEWRMNEAAERLFGISVGDFVASIIEAPTTWLHKCQPH